MPDTRTDTAISAGKHPILLDDLAQLNRAREEWRQPKILGLDTEFVRERTYRAGLGLVQVSDGKTAWLGDPLVEGSTPVLADLLTDASCLKIFHSASEDLEVLHHSLGALPEPMVDTQVACALLGQPLQLGYHHAIKWLFDVEIDKDQTRSNWLKRPLTERQLHYAAMDVVLLPAMWEKLKTRIEAKGRLEWLHEEVSRMKTRAVQAVEPREAYLRLGGIGRMDDRSLRVLRSLAAWREESARRRDRARNFVVNDRALMQMAHDKPSTISEIRKIEEIHPRALRRMEDELLESIEAGRADETPVFKPEPLTPQQRALMKALKAVVQKKARELDVDPALLASRKQLEHLLRSVESEEELPERFRGWRRDVMTEELLRVFS